MGLDNCFVSEQTSDPRRQDTRMKVKHIHNMTSSLLIRSSGATENFVLHSEPTGFANACPDSVACKLSGLTADDQVQGQTDDKISQVSSHVNTKCTLLLIQSYSWLDGNAVETSQWCFAAGASVDWPVGTSYFPGFCDLTNGHEANYVELYTYQGVE